MSYLSCMRKWHAFHRGALVQIFPDSVPPRKYISHEAAQKMKLPFNQREAWLKLSYWLTQCKADWELDEIVHDEQMKICLTILELGNVLVS